ncbi:MAG TPA: DUF4097 family beta strand repeat-containing protein [Symbiobacteriaceae bacterium]|jgi:hypothetical protein
MTPVSHRVGRITVAVGLIGFGVALLMDNLSASQSGLSLLLKLWPLILIGFGAEYLIRSLLAQRAEGETRLRFDWGGAFLLFLVGILAVGIMAFRTFVSGGIDATNLPFNFGPGISRNEQWNLPATGVKELVTDIDVGAISIEQSARTDALRVEATYTANGLVIDREALRREMDSIKMNVEQGETVRFRPQIAGNLHDVSIRYVIYAPPGLKIRASTGTGWLNVTGYKGDLDLTSRVGRISVQASSGTLTAGSGSGWIQIRNFDGPVSAKTTVGALDLTDMNGPVQLDSGTGTINVQEFRGGKLVAESKTGSVRAATRAVLEGDVIMRTQNGSVSLTAPRESSMRVTADTRTGNITVPSFMNVNRNGAGSSAVGSSGDGKFTVTLEANTGTVNFHTP